MTFKLDIKKYVQIFFAATFLTFFCCVTSFAEINAESNLRAYLYFYNLEGDPIDELTEILIIDEKDTYTFKDPDKYKCYPYYDEFGNEYYPDWYDEVTGISWMETDGDGNNIKEYKKGDKDTFTAGEHYFYLKSDHPELTGENLLDRWVSDFVYLYFYSADEEEIYDLDITIYKDDTYKFYDPAKYTYLDEEEAKRSGKDYTGIYWGCTDDNGKHYLFEDGDTCNFKPGEYFFYVMTDEPVTVRYYYPDDVPTYWITNHYDGELYATVTAQVGDKITLKKGLGAIIWGCDFAGWNEWNYEEDSSKIFKGGASYQIMDNVDLSFYAVYEENDDWDEDAVDKNKTAEELSQETDKTVVDIVEINEAAGVGYNAYVYDDGTLRRYGGNGIKGNIESGKDSSLTSLKSDGDPTNPEDYEKERTSGKTFEELGIEPDMANVLKEDNSALYMDVYGNAFVYYSDLTRVQNMELALRRLQDGKTDSWVFNIQDWNPEIIARFEAIEFAILYNQYPKEGEDLFAKLDPAYTMGEELIWHESYMSEKAYKDLKTYRQLWTGWYDEYYDTYYEDYKEINAKDKTPTVGALNVYRPDNPVMYDDKRGYRTANA